jgi:2-hydroxychromene-2-carboxylate isomerase
MRPLQFHYDFLSPYAYLAWTQIDALATRHNRELEPVAVLFAALLEANGQLGPAEIPRKRLYVFKDVLRTAHLLGVPLTPPPAHPFNSLLGLRVCSCDLSADDRRRAIDALFRAVWAGGPGITEPDVVRRLLDHAGLDGAALLAQAATEPIKERVKTQTAQALAAGAFGVPSILADGELFWGLDSFPHLERRLRGQDPIDGIDLQRWHDLPAQAVRPKK